MATSTLLALPKPSAAIVALAKLAKSRPLKNQPTVKRTICDDDVADRVFKHLEKRIDKDTLVLDVQAGIGLLSRRLIDSQARSVRAIETNVDLRDELEVLATFREQGRYSSDRREWFGLHSPDRSVQTSRWLYEDGKPGYAKKVLVTGSLVGGRIEQLSNIAFQMLEGGVVFPKSLVVSLVILMRENDIRAFTEPGKYYQRKQTMFNIVTTCKVLETFHESDLHPFYGSDGNYKLVELTRNDLGMSENEAEDLSSFLHLFYGKPSQTIDKALRMLGSGSECLLSRFPPEFGDMPVRTVPPEILLKLFKEFARWPDRPPMHHEAMTFTRKGMKVKA